jgi:nitroimidazol reductase NimA-like FMN-containing flavoprotein (pyridoxamine 5'-phosphate oxidase superfamily)
MAKLDVSMTPDEVDAFLAAGRTVRLATSDTDGTPHVVPLWYVWEGGVMYLNSTLGNTTVENAERSGVASGVVDDGESYDDLRGVTVTGRVQRLEGDAPPEVERAWSEKYLGGMEPPYRHWRNRAWFRLTPWRVASWDFRKIPEARARRAGSGSA